MESICTEKEIEIKQKKKARIFGQSYKIQEYSNRRDQLQSLFLLYIYIYISACICFYQAASTQSVRRSSNEAFHAFSLLSQRVRLMIEQAT